MALKFFLKIKLIFLLRGIEYKIFKFAVVIYHSLLKPCNLGFKR